MDGVQPEVFGSDYFDSLVKVGFLQYSYEDWMTDEVVYKIHDLIHDLSRHILEDELVTCLPSNMIANHTQRCRYISLTSFAKKVHGSSFDKVHALFVSNSNPIHSHQKSGSIGSRVRVEGHSMQVSKNMGRRGYFGTMAPNQLGSMARVDEHEEGPSDD